MSAKSIIGVIVVAVLIGVLYVVFEKNLTDAASTTSPSIFKKSQQNLPTPAPSTILSYPAPKTYSEINENSNLLDEASGLEMRDYSPMFEDLKDTANK